MGVADTQVVQTTHSLVQLVIEAPSDAQGDEFDKESSEEDVESEKILADPQLSTP